MNKTLFQLWALLSFFSKSRGAYVNELVISWNSDKFSKLTNLVALDSGNTLPDRSGERYFELLFDTKSDLTDLTQTVNQVFYYASEKGLLDVLEGLLNTNNQIDIFFLQKGFCEAAKNGHFKVVELLLSRFGVNDIDKKTVDVGLNHSSMNGHFDIVKLLLESRRNFDYSSINHVFYFAVIYGRFDIVKGFLNDNDSYTKKITNLLYIQKGLCAASERGHLDVVVLLLSHFGREYFDAKTVSSALLNASAKGHVEVVKSLLENRGDDVIASYLSDALRQALKNRHLNVVRFLLERSDISVKAPFVVQALFDASTNGHLDTVNLLLELITSHFGTSSIGHVVTEASRRGYLDVVEIILKSNLNVTISFVGQGLVEALKNEHFNVVRLLIDGQYKSDPESISEFEHLDVLKALHFINLQNNTHTRVGLINNDHCCRMISFVSGLFNIYRFREVLYSSEYENQTSLKLATLFVRMQLSNENIDMETSFAYYFKKDRVDFENFWWSILDLRNNILELLPQTTKNIFQVKTRVINKHDTRDHFYVTRNFITVFKSYKSLSEAITAKFFNDISDDAKHDTLSLQNNSYELEILNRPEILLFGIVSSSSEMELDFELELPSLGTATEPIKYYLQAFCYGGKHQMSFIRDFTYHSAGGDWYRYNDHEVKNSVGEVHLKSLIKNANTNASFAYYVRSDASRSTCPDIPQNVFDQIVGLR